MTRHNHKVSTNRQGFPRLHFKVGLAASQAKKKKNPHTLPGGSSQGIFRHREIGEPRT